MFPQRTSSPPPQPSRFLPRCWILAVLRIHVLPRDRLLQGPPPLSTDRRYQVVLHLPVLGSSLRVEITPRPLQQIKRRRCPTCRDSPTLPLQRFHKALQGYPRLPSLVSVLRNLFRLVQDRQIPAPLPCSSCLPSFEKLRLLRHEQLRLFRPKNHMPPILSSPRSFTTSRSVVSFTTS